MNVNIINRKYVFLSISAALVIAGWACVVIFGLHPGIDLQGGTNWMVSFQNGDVTAAQVQSALSKNMKSSLFSVEKSGDNTFTLRLPPISEAEHQADLTALREIGSVTEGQFTSIGPTIGAELKNKAIWAIVLVLFGISTYVAWAFRKVSRPVASWKYGLVTLLTLFHDVSIPLGLVALLGVEIDTNIIVALLVVMGFSVHDTIVVFDRIRENIRTRWRERDPLDSIVNQSIHETMMRSINTSFALVLVLVALMIWGPHSLFFFLLALLVGTVVGTYSSIFVASPLLYLWRGK